MHITGERLMPRAATPAAYIKLQGAYEFFNRQLFENALPRDLIITLQVKSRSLGHFAADRFKGRVQEGRLHELNLNPAAFKDSSDEEICSTLVHEMAHVWQQCFGNPGRGAYHNKEWAAKMKAVGLYPSSTGKPGGKETGQSMSHYVLEGGPYQTAFRRMAGNGWRLDWERASEGERTSGQRTKYLCPSCRSAVWGRPDLRITCDDCSAPMLSRRAAVTGATPLAGLDAAA
jgi:predicted SprT family Zn-dependent metalloprotease